VAINYLRTTDSARSMDRKILIILSIIAFLPSPRAQAQNECVSIDKLFTERLPQIGGKQWLGHQLKREGEVWYLIFSQKTFDPSSTARKWVVAARHSAERPDVYCIVGVGLRVGVLASLHDSMLEERYGLPGSNYPRCGKRDDPLEGFKVRAWASRELGDSLILSLDDAQIGNPTFVLLMSKIDNHWIMLQKRPEESTCYRDRGNFHHMRALELR
jgi:hypothetical protein